MSEGGHRQIQKTRPNPSGQAAARAEAAAEELPLPVAVEPAPAPAPHPRRMLDRYEIIAEIAKGGMGTVYLARLSGAGGFERLMALKVMHDHLAEDDTFVTMLLDEARTAAHIHHPNAVGITDVVESPVGYYLVMDFVDGFPLSHIVTHPEMTERERIAVGSRLIVDAANGLHAAHSARNAKGEKLGIVHRDVSPQNVLVGRDGSGRIVDFGIALAASRVASSRPGTLKGKPQYMAPEQAKGEPCDPRTDVFALGIMLWEVLTYERLFFGEMDVAVLVQVMECNVPSPRERNPNVSEGLAKVALKALSRLPQDRYGSAREFGAALEKAASEAGVFATTADTEAIIERLFAEEITLRDAAIHAHMDRSAGEPLPMKRGELQLVSKLFEKKRVPKHREMHTRTGGDVAAPIPGSGVRSRASMEAAVAPTAMAPSVPAPAPAAKSPPMAVVVGAVLGSLALLSLGAYALSTALNARPTTPAVAAPSASMPSTDPIFEAPEVPMGAMGGTVAEVPAEVPVEVPAENVVETAPIVPPTAGAGASGSGRRRDRGTTTPETVPTAPTPPTEPSGPSGPTFEANPYLGH